MEMTNYSYPATHICKRFASLKLEKRYEKDCREALKKESHGRRDRHFIWRRKSAISL
jgi:hypothetical protein